MVALIQGADNETLETYANTFGEKVENKFKATCKKCGSQEFTRQSSQSTKLNPDQKTIERYVGAVDNAIIIKNLNSEAPIHKGNNINVPTLEKILVDIIADDALFSAQQGELEFIFKSAFDKYNINKSKMKRYASRRNRVTEIKNQTNIITAK